MKIWFDLTNSPHIPFFKNIISDVCISNDVLITCRPLANTIELLDLTGLEYHVVGTHYGQKLINKIVGYFVRIWQLYNYLKNKDIDVSISHSSFYSPIVSKLLGARCIYLNDNEHAKGNIVSFIFANNILIPEFLNIKKVKKQLAREEKIKVYPGVKEGVYLWPFLNQEKKIDLNLNHKKTIFVRPEPWAAQYYSAKSNFIDELLIDLNKEFRVFLLPRGEAQRDYYANKKFKGVIIPENSISFDQIVTCCDLFIGAGGTMTREAAVMGIPTISIYQDVLLDVDRYLIEKKMMLHNKNLTLEIVKDYLTKNKKNKPNTELLKKGREAHNLILSTLIEYQNYK